MATLNREFFLSQFREEARDHLQRMTHTLLQLEEHPEDVKLLLEELLRVAHTLKGSARMMGYADISALAHRMEDLFVEIRDEHLSLQPAASELLLYSLDTINYLVEGLYKNVKRTADIAQIGALFDALLAGKPIDVPSLPTPSAEPIRAEASAPVSPTASKPEPLAGEPEEEHYVRVHPRDLDQILNLVGEMLINQYRYDGQLVAFSDILQTLQQHRHALQSVHEAIYREPAATLSAMTDQLDQTSAWLWRRTKTLAKRIKADRQYIHQIMNNLQAQVINIRMASVARIFHLLPQLVKMTARRLGKQVEIRIQGRETRIDSRILEEIRDPLIHLIQNAIWHGIESPEERQQRGKPLQGVITVAAGQEGNRITLRVQDDGRGIDLERIRATALEMGIISPNDVHSLSDQDLYELLFQPGFSTSETVDDIAGRGFGLDIVRNRVDRVQGEIEVHSRVGQGATFTLKLPLTLTIMNALLVRAAGQIFAIPTTAVEKTFDVAPAAIEQPGRIPTIPVDDVLLPVVELSAILQRFGRHPLHQPADAPASEPEQLAALRTVIVIHSEEHRIGFLVDDLVEEGEIVIKHLGSCLKRVRNVAGAATVREDTVLILLVRDLIHSADAFLGEAVAHATLLDSAAHSQTPRPALGKPIPRILVVDDSLNTREVERTILENAGYRVDTAVNGGEALEKLKKTPFDLVVTDLEMPEMDGMQLLHILQQDERLRRLPVVVVSARKTVAEQQRSLAAGAAAHIMKSVFEEDTLLKAVKTCLNGDLKNSSAEASHAEPKIQNVP